MLTGNRLHPMLSKRRFLVLVSLTLIAYGYWRLAVPPDALYDVVLFRAKTGMLSVVAGGGFLAAWLTLR